MGIVNRCHGGQSAFKSVYAGETSILGLIVPGVKVRGLIEELQSCTRQQKSSRMQAALAWKID